MRFDNTSYSFRISLMVWNANRTVERSAPICEKELVCVDYGIVSKSFRLPERWNFEGVFKCTRGQLGSLIRLNGG